ncbi:MAG TPA: hypothetical protein VHG27_04710 [Xanthobacteraceae bacterium]|nr:hypothetical protein [Xanthobacteraceae bacterium]
MFLVAFPLLIVPLAIYNIMALLLNVEWNTAVATIAMISGGSWTITISDLFLAVTLFFLFWELIKATGSSTRSVIDHMLSTLVFIVALVEFLLVRQAATSTFALLILICLVDVIAGFSVSIRTARRDFSVERADMI